MRKLTTDRFGLYLIRVDCTGCDEPQIPARKEGDPKTVVRCFECGKRHSRDSLVSLNPDEGDQP